MSVSSLLEKMFGVSVGGDSEDQEEEREDEFEDEEAEDEEREDEDETDNEEEEAPRFGFRMSNPFKSRGKKQKRHEEESGEYEEEEERAEAEKAASYTTTKRGNVIHDSRVGGQAPKQGHTEIVFYVRQLEECRDIIHCLLSGNSVVFNLENIEQKDCGRVVDLLSGAAFALNGRMVKVGYLSYLLAPNNVEVLERQSGASVSGAAYY